MGARSNRAWGQAGIGRQEDPNCEFEKLGSNNGTSKRELMTCRLDPCSTVTAMTTPERCPKLPTDMHAGQGVADPRYLLAKVSELRDIANQAGLERSRTRSNVRGWSACGS